MGSEEPRLEKTVPRLIKTLAACPPAPGLSKAAAWPVCELSLPLPAPVPAISALSWAGRWPTINKLTEVTVSGGELELPMWPTLV